MRVLITTDVAGGVWSFTEELVDALHVRGHELVLAALGGEPGAAHRAWASARPWLRFASLPYPLEWMPEPEPGLTRSAQALRELCDESRPDVVHLNQFFYGACDLGAPAVVTAHSDVVSWWHAVKGEAPPEDAWFARYRRWVSSGLAGAAVRAAPTRWIARRTEELYGAGEVRVAHNARSAARFYAPVDVPRSRRVVAAGRLWDEAKAVTDLVAAAPALSAGGIGVAVAGPVKHPARGRDFTVDAAGVEWLGVVEPAALRDLLAASQMYAATARYEPFGLAPLEAALAGCALVASDIPTLRELWDGCAEFYPAGDARALAEVVRRLADEPARRRELAHAAQTRALERYSPERLAAEYEAVYREATDACAGTGVTHTEATRP